MWLSPWAGFSLSGGAPLPLALSTVPHATAVPPAPGYASCHTWTTGRQPVTAYPITRRIPSLWRHHMVKKGQEQVSEMDSPRQGEHVNPEDGKIKHRGTGSHSGR